MVNITNNQYIAIQLIKLIGICVENKMFIADIVTIGITITATIVSNAVINAIVVLSIFKFAYYIMTHI